jgi:ketosteroid isomerase-like protein
MAHPNEDRIRVGFEAFAAGDMAALMPLWTEDVAWHSAGDSPLSGDFNGHEELIGLFANVAQLSGGSYTTEINDIVANDSVGFARGTGAAARNGKTLDDTSVWVFKFRGDQVSEVWFHPFDGITSNTFWND